MYYPEIQNNQNTRSTIDTFYGLKHSYKVAPGEFYNMENLSSDGFPVLTIRDARTTLLAISETENVDEENNRTWSWDGEYLGCLHTGGELAYLMGSVFHYGSWSLNIGKLLSGEANKVTVGDDEPQRAFTLEYQELIRFGSYILMFPSNIWVSLTEKEAGTIGAKYSEAPNRTVTYSMCDINGDAYSNVTTADTAPSNPQKGDYWLCTAEGKEGLNIYTGDSWSPVATTYIKVSMPGAHLTECFSEGDVVYLNTHLVPDINEGSVIQKIEDEYIVVLGFIKSVLTEETNISWTLTVERKIPHLDYVCVSKNRVWGCRYGYDAGDPKLYNEIYCSKLGDFKNWYSYQGLSTDSYAVSIGSPGAFTGCISYQGYPTFFKENMMYRIFGNYPAEYSLTEKEVRGVQNGSSKSLAIMGEFLYYKAPGGVMVYDGSTPTMISSAFGRDIYYFDGIAGVAGNKYYLQCTNDKNKTYIYVYDSEYGIWTRESQFVEFRKNGEMPLVNVLGFTYTTDGKLFAMTSHALYGIGQKDDPMYETKVKGGEDYVKWSCETGDFGFEYADFKYVDKISVRAYLPHISEIRIEISYDDKPYELIGTLRGNATTSTQEIQIHPSRCDHFRLKLNGHGAVRIYNISTILDAESEENAYKN